MKFGIVGSSGTVRQMVEMAAEAEEHGWDGFFTWDGIAVGPMDVWDPWAVLAAAAMRTERIRLGAMVFALPRRNPWELVRQTLTIDHLSGGRLVLPVGVGAIEDRGFSGVREAPKELRTRAELLDETLAILDLAWRGETFSVDGTHHAATDVQFLPRPVQRPRIPVWVVGAWPSVRSSGRAARWDGVLPQYRGDKAMDQLTPVDVAEIAAWIAERRARDGLEGSYDVVLQGETSDDLSAAAAHLRPLADAGGTWWVESRWTGERATPDALLARIRQGPPR